MTTAETRRGWLRRLAPLLLLAAALIAFRLVAPKVAHERDVVYELGDLAREVVRLDVFWSDPHRPREAPAFSSTWYFAPGKAPQRLASTVRLHDGEWDVDARLELVPPAAPERVSRRVELREGTTIIRLAATSAPSSPAHD